MSMTTQVRIGDVTIEISVDKYKNITIVSDGHLYLVMQSMGLPGVSGPELYFDTKQLVNEVNTKMQKTAILKGV